MKTSQKVLDLVAEYQADPNCRPDLWFNDLIRTNEATKEEVEECLDIVMFESYKKIYSVNLTEEQHEIRLDELLTVDRRFSGTERERNAKIKALKYLSSKTFPVS